ARTASPEAPSTDIAPVRERSSTTAPVRVEADHPAVAGAAPAQANPQVTAPRGAAAADSPRKNKTSPRSAPIDEGEAGAPASDGRGLPAGRKFSRTGRAPQTSSDPGPHDDSAAGLSPGQVSGGLAGRAR